MLRTFVWSPIFALGLLSIAPDPARAELKFHCDFDGNDPVDQGAAPAAELVTNDTYWHLTEDTPGDLSCFAFDGSDGVFDSLYVETVGDADKLDALNSMTVTFWLNMFYNPDEYDVLISDAEPFPPYPPAGVGGWEIAVSGVGGQDPTNDNFALTFGIFESQGWGMQETGATSPAIDAGRRWVFVAVMYTSPGYQMFFIGDEDTPPTQIGYLTHFGMAIPDNDAPLRINGASFDPLEDWSPPAYLDDVRIYDTGMNVSQLDAIRRENLEDLYDPAAAPSFHRIRGYPGHGCGCGAEGVSDDGTFVVGSAELDYDSIAFRWQNSVMTPLGDLPGGSDRSRAYDVSNDGSVVVGYGYSAHSSWEAFRWENGTMYPLGDLAGGNFESYAWGVSGDGSVIVGTGTIGDRGDSEAYRWDNEVMQGLGYEVSASVAEGISADGTRIAGTTDTAAGVEACYWEDGTLTPIGDLPGGAVLSYARAISPDGSAIVGFSEAEGATEAFLWKNGQITGLGFLNSTYKHSEARAVSNNGRIVVGISLLEQYRQEAFIWDEVNGMRPLASVLETEHGIDLSGWLLNWAEGVSADGGVIVGSGRNPDGESEGWIVRLPLPEMLRDIDLDNDNDVDFDDIELFEDCATGPGVPYDPSNLPPGCVAEVDDLGILSVDFDRDRDVDQGDFGGLVQPCFSGDGNTPPDGCIPEE